MKIFTIGFNKKSAAEFFEALKANSIRRLIDIRLKNTSQIAGFTKKNDLEYFLEKIAGADYHHLPLLAPTEDILKAYKSGGGWDTFERAYAALLDERRVADALDRALFDRDVALLCSEETADRCHRRLAAEFLAPLLGAEAVIHL